MSEQFQFDRRRFLRTAALLGAGATVAACAGPGSTKSGSGAATASSAAPLGSGPVTGDISFAHWRAEDKAVFDQIITEFVAANPQAKVTQDISPSNDYQSTALQKIKGGSIGDAFTAFRGAQFVNMAKAGLFVELANQPFVSNYIPSLITAGQDASGKQLGLPYQLVFNMPIYNKAIFDQAGISEIPKDWEGFLALCDKLKSSGVVPIAWPGGETANAGQLINAMVMNNMPADDAFAGIEAGKYKITDDWFLTTLKQYAQLAPYFEPNSTGTSSEPLQQMFASGKAAMLATGSFHIGAVRKLGATFPVDLIAPITVAKDKMKYEGIYNATFILGVNSNSKKQEAALKWLSLLSDPKVAAEYANGTSQHLTVKDVDYSNADLKATAPWLAKKTLLAPRFQFNDLDIRNAVETACVQVVGGKDPQQAADAGQRIIDQKRG